MVQTFNVYTLKRSNVKRLTFQRILNRLQFLR